MTVSAALYLRPESESDRPIAVLIVDDSVVARAALSHLVESDSALYVAGAVSSAFAAAAWLHRNRADVVLLDLEMPGRNGLDALPELIAAGGGARILIVASTAREGARATLQALALGAADTLAKPEAGQLNQSFGVVLTERVRRLGRAQPTSGSQDSYRLREAAHTPVALLAVGSSTGGLPALAEMFANLPATFAAPVVLTQHLPPAFMPFFAEQVATMSGRPATVAIDGQGIDAGTVLVAPGNAHLQVASINGKLRVLLSDAAAESRCCPSVDPMLASAAEAVGEGVTAVVLTGMGRDGAGGAAAVVAAGGSVIAQDRASSTVWGMPGAVVRSGLASVVGTPAELARHLVARGSA